MIGDILHKSPERRSFTGSSYYDIFCYFDIFD